MTVCTTCGKPPAWHHCPTCARYYVVPACEHAANAPCCGRKGERRDPPAEVASTLSRSIPQAPEAEGAGGAVEARADAELEAVPQAIPDPAAPSIQLPIDMSSVDVHVVEQKVAALAEVAQEKVKKGHLPHGVGLRVVDFLLGFANALRSPELKRDMTVVEQIARGLTMIAAGISGGSVAHHAIACEGLTLGEQIARGVGLLATALASGGLVSHAWDLAGGLLDALDGSGVDPEVTGQGLEAKALRDAHASIGHELAVDAAFPGSARYDLLEAWRLSIDFDAVDAEELEDLFKLAGDDAICLVFRIVDDDHREELAALDVTREKFVHELLELCRGAGGGDFKLRFLGPADGEGRHVCRGNVHVTVRARDEHDSACEIAEEHVA